jgi:OOP family OmpA-OmpF porin
VLDSDRREDLMKRAVPGGVLAFLVLVLLAPASWAQQAPEREFGFLLGLASPSQTLSGYPQNLNLVSPLLGLRAATEIKPNVLLFGDLTGSRYDQGSDPSLNTAEYALRVGPEFLLGKKARFFVSPAVGWAYFFPREDPDFNRGLLSLGIGQRLVIEGSDALRWEFRVENTFDGSGSGPKSFANAQLLLGFSFGKPPLDSDGDGVPDRTDACPGTPKGAIVDAKGCPMDSDGDGVWDGIDRCPDTPKGAIVDATGCPKDSDGDGVWDGIDRCPNTPKGAVVDAFGCPKDSDGDGVWDGIDRCPNTPRAVKVDEFGCEVKAAPAIAPVPKALVLEGVNFESDSATLLSSSLAVLDRVAAMLKDWPDVRVEVAGYTDSTNTDAYNQKLSERRAEAVRSYLVSQGVAADRLTAMGYGESSPVADNGTKDGRLKNRRVELHRLN